MMRRLLGLCRMMSNKLSSRNCRRSVRSSVAALYSSANRGAFSFALWGIGYFISTFDFVSVLSRPLGERIKATLVIAASAQDAKAAVWRRPGGEVLPADGARLPHGHSVEHDRDNRPVAEPGHGAAHRVHAELLPAAPHRRAGQTLATKLNALCNAKSKSVDRIHIAFDYDLVHLTYACLE